MSAEGGEGVKDGGEIEAAGDTGTPQTAGTLEKEETPAAISPDKEQSPGVPEAAPASPKPSKVDVLLKPAGNAPILKKKRWTVDRHKKIGWISDFIRKFIRTETEDSVFVYVNQSFSPSPDTDIGTLFDCFGSDGKLVIYYCRTQAWG